MTETLSSGPHWVSETGPHLAERIGAGGDRVCSRSVFPYRLTRVGHEPLPTLRTLEFVFRFPLWLWRFEANPNDPASRCPTEPGCGWERQSGRGSQARPENTAPTRPAGPVTPDHCSSQSRANSESCFGSAKPGSEAIGCFLAGSWPAAVPHLPPLDKPRVRAR